MANYEDPDQQPFEEIGFPVSQLFARYWMLMQLYMHSHFLSITILTLWPEYCISNKKAASEQPAPSLLEKQSDWGVFVQIIYW